MFSFFSNPLLLILWLAALIIAVTIHEFAHAFAADRLGDPTPKLMGRLTLNPLAHLDVLGTLMLLIARFGWGKPVQIDPFNLQNPRRDSALIALAGPLSNLLLAVVLSLILRTGFDFYFVSSFLKLLVMLNVVLALFNLLPIHPLDGFNIVEGFLPEEQAKDWHSLSSYGLIFLLVLIFPLTNQGSLGSQLLNPPIDFILRLLLG